MSAVSLDPSLDCVGHFRRVVTNHKLGRRRPNGTAAVKTGTAAVKTCLAGSEAGSSAVNTGTAAVKTGTSAGAGAVGYRRGPGVDCGWVL